MTLPPASPRFYAIAILIVLALAWLVVAYMRQISCAWCRAPFAIFPRAAGDLCRSCSSVFDHHRIKIGHRRSLLQRIRRVPA